jgi:hypothetical protein
MLSRLRLAKATTSRTRHSNHDMLGDSSPGSLAALHFPQAIICHFQVCWARIIGYLRPKTSNNASQSPIPFKPGPILFVPEILSKLPTDILYTILEELSLPDKLTLAQTCRAFQHVIYKVSYHDDSDLRHRHRPGRSMQEFLTVDEQLEYLCQVTRNRPNSWACHVSVAAHAKIDFQDTPRHKTLQNQMNHPCKGPNPSNPNIRTARAPVAGCFW